MAAPQGNFGTINPRLVELNNGQAVAPTGSILTENIILDKDWVKVAFMVPSGGFSDNYDSVSRFFSSASMKFTTGVLGGSIEINPKPQFTRYCDIRTRGIMPNRNDVSITNSSGNYGMGRYYSEAIDDNAQKIYMRFGVPQFNSIMSFLLNASDYGTSQLARTGRISKLYLAAKAISAIATFVAFPLLSTLVYLGQGVSALLGMPTSKYYTLKPTMHLYWSTVNTIVNTIGVSKGLMPSIVKNLGGTAINQPGQLYDINGEVTDGNGNLLPNTTLGQLQQIMPDIINGSGYFDVFAIAAKTQVIANQIVDQIYSTQQGTSLISNNITVTTNMRNNPEDPAFLQTDVFSNINLTKNLGLVDFINTSVLKFKDFFVETLNHSATETDPRTATTSSIDTNQKVQNGPTVADSSQPNSPSKTGFTDYLSAEFQGGASFAIFQVNYTGPVSESFSNSAVESQLSSKINTTSSTAREARFDLEDGNVVGGIPGKVVGAVTSAVGNVAAGALDGATFGYGSGVLSALGILAGNGYIDIPKHWESSSASLPRSTYEIDLVSPYGNVISQMMNIYIPLSMLLAGTLPLSTGKQSYTSPFLVQLFDRGRCQVQLGLIESLSITRGTSNLGFTNLGSPLAMKASFSVVDLSSIISMPISSGSIFNIGNTSSDNLFNDYVAVLAGQDIYSQIYALPRLQLNLAKALNSANRFLSPAYWASAVHHTTTAGFLSFFPVGTIARGIEGLKRGSSVLTGLNGKM